MPDYRAQLRINQNAIIGALIDPRTSDPSFVEGQIWYRSDLDELRLAISGAAYVSFRRTDTAIVNADISATANIALSKLATDPLARANHTGTQLANTISNFDTQVRTSRLDQMAAPTAAVSMNSQKITGLADGTSSNDAASWGQVQALVQGLRVKGSVRAATTANLAPTSPTTQTLPLGGTTLTVDGVTVANGDRILVKNQTTNNQNGIYVVSGIGSSVLLTRAADADTWDELAAAFTFVEQGTTNGETGWVSTTNTGGGTLGTNGIPFTQFAGYGTILDGAGLSLVGNTMDVNVDGSTIEIISDQLRVKDLGITAGKIANTTITNAQISASAAIARSKLDFGSGLVNADIATAAAIARSKLDFGTGLVNADISASAAIALSKLATDPLARANHTGTQTAATISDFNTAVRTNRLDQMAAPTAAVAMNNQKLTGLADGTATTDAATWGQVQNLIQGIDPKSSVRVATTGNITLSGTQTIDGISVVAGERVLVKDQTSTTENGIYVAAVGAWTRATDADSWAEIVNAFVFIEEGAVNGSTGWLSTGDTGGTIGSTPMPWTQFTGAGQIVAGSGLTKSGNQLDVGAGTGIVVAADTVAIDPATVPRRVKVAITGNGSTTVFGIAHNLNLAVTDPPVVQVWQASSSGQVTTGSAQVQAEVTWFSNNAVRVEILPAPTSSEHFIVVVMG